MNWLAICNIIIVNIIIWLALSYFWSTWNYRVFKPWLWLEQKKRKQLHKDIESIERSVQDKNRFYASWFALEQIDVNQIDGCIVLAGCEDTDTAKLVNRHSPERHLVIVDPFKSRNVTITRENCQGEVSTQEININSVELDVFKNEISSDNIEYLEGNICELIQSINNNISFAQIDSVDYDEVTACLTHIYPLLSDGGIIIVHDYNHNWDTVRNAVNHFEAGVPENFIGIPDMYGSVVLIKNTTSKQVL